MRLLCIKFLLLVGIFGLFLASCTSDAYAAIGSVSGEVIVKPTGAGVANIWVEWRSPVTITVVHTNSYGGIDTINGMPGEGEIGIRYTKTDSSGKFLFPHWAFGAAYAVRGGTQNDKGGVSYPILDSRARQYLTWIKPLEPEVPPDMTAVVMYDRYLDETNYDYNADVNSNDGGTCCVGYKSAVAQASKYRPAGTGWVRMANRTDINGGFQCNAPPLISAVKPTNFKGFFDNNDQQLHNWGNGYTPIVIPEPIEFNPTGPMGFHDGDGTNPSATNANPNSCSVYGWARNLDTDQKYDVRVFVGGPEGSGAPSFTIKADKVRSDSLSGFGFDFQLPAQFQDGVKRDIYTYAVDLDGSLTPLAQSPRSLICGIPKPGSTTQPNPSPTSTPPVSTPLPLPPITLSPKVDLWAESGVIVTGRGSSGGTMRVDPGQPFTLFWTAANASTCVASGSWAGIKQAGITKLSKAVADPQASQTYNYTLTCFNNESGLQESDSVIVQVNTTKQAPFIQTKEGDVHSNEGIDVP